MITSQQTQSVIDSLWLQNQPPNKNVANQRQTPGGLVLNGLLVQVRFYHQPVELSYAIGTIQTFTHSLVIPLNQGNWEKD